jgi:hypothetical protein
LATKNLRLKRTVTRTKLSILIFISFCTTLISGCVSLYDPESSQDNRSEIITTVHAGQVFEQSFASKHSRFNSLEFWVKPESNTTTQDSRLLVELYQTNQPNNPFFVASYKMSDIVGDTPLKLTFSPRVDPPNNRYTLKIKPQSASVQLFGRNDDIYSLGASTQGGNQLQADLGFYLYDEYSIDSLIGDLSKVLSNIWIIVAIILILFIPGWLLIDISGLSKTFDPGEQIGLAIAISLSLVSSLMAWTTLLSWRWSRSAVLGVSLLIFLLCGWRIYQKRNDFLRANHPRRINWILLSLLGIFIITLVSRLIMIRNLVAPPWVDSIQHGLITRLILENGGYPQTYLPYMNIQGYHTGFHSLVATFCWMTNLNIPAALLLLGQVLNALIVFAIYLFSNTFIESKIAGLFAALAVGLLSPMPAYYTSWGRYPQLAGLLILPAGLALLHPLYTHMPMRNSRELLHFPTRKILITSIIMSGLLLTHYRVAAFFACLIIVDYLLSNLKIVKVAYMNLYWRISFQRILITLAVTAVLVMPWLPKVLVSLIAPKFGVGKPSPLFSGIQPGYLTSVYGNQLLILAGCGLLIALYHRKKFTATLMLWFGLLFFLANLSYFRLPGGVFINNNSVGISLFIPITILFGYCSYVAFKWVKNFLPPTLKQSATPSITILCLFIAGFASTKIIPILNPITFLAREADMQAMPWIEEHLPLESKIMVNPFLWGYSLYAGSDGGYWISTMTGRQTIPPPILYGLDNDSDRIKQTSELIAQSISFADDADNLAELLTRHNIDYIYLGARGGVFSPSRLMANSRFILLYQKDGVRIFQIR